MDLTSADRQPMERSPRLLPLPQHQHRPRPHFVIPFFQDTCPRQPLPWVVLHRHTLCPSARLREVAPWRLDTTTRDPLQRASHRPQQAPRFILNTAIRHSSCTSRTNSIHTSSNPTNNTLTTKKRMQVNRVFMDRPMESAQLVTTRMHLTTTTATHRAMQATRTVKATCLD